MTTMTYQRKITYRAGLFDRENLDSLDKIADSICHFESVINEHNYVQALNDFWDKTHIIELILSGIFLLCKPLLCNLTDFEFVDMSNIPLNAWIMKNFPTDFNSFESSFERRLLNKLSKFDFFATAPDDTEYYRTVSFSPEVLQTLSAMASLKDEEQQPESSPKKGKAKSQKQKKKHTSVQEYNIRPLDRAAFVDLGIDIPCTSSEAQASLTMFLGRLKDILEVRPLNFFVTCFLSIINERIVLSKQDAIASDRELDQRWLHCAS